jgi:hypothetical protein
MQQRQLRLGDILDDYCPRERRITNHAIVAMVGQDVKQTRCTTCDAEHEYKHAKVPRQRRKSETPAALYSQVAAGAPKRVAHEDAGEETNGADAKTPAPDAPEPPMAAQAPEPPDNGDDEMNEPAQDVEEGPVHRPLIRATLPRPEGQPPPARPAPDFTIRSAGGRQNRFRQRMGRGGGLQFGGGNRSNGNLGGGGLRGNGPRPGGGRPPHGNPSSRQARRHGPKRQK